MSNLQGYTEGLATYKREVNVFKEYDAGVNKRLIARVLGMSTAEVTKIIRNRERAPEWARQNPPRFQSSTLPKLEKICRDRANGYSLREIGKRYGLSKNAVHEIVGMLPPSARVVTYKKINPWGK